MKSLRTLLYSSAIACALWGMSIASESSQYQIVPNWLKPPAGMTTIGNGHGDVAVDSKGLIYVSAGGAKAGVQIYDEKGNYLRNLKNAPGDFHGFVIRQENGEDILLGSRLGGSSILKLDLEGNVKLTIDCIKTVPEKYMTEKKGRKFFRLTSVDLAPNGDIYTVDGYGKDYIHVFNSKGEYKTTFGGREAPYNLKTVTKSTSTNALAQLVFYAVIAPT